MTTPEVLIVYGKDLNEEELSIINKYRKFEFNSSTEIKPKPEDETWRELFFLVRDVGQLVAFGRLRNITVMFRGTRYPILGVATIVAVKKGRGYGRLIMEKMHEYVKKSRKTAIGFCDPAQSGFYEKCGYEILNNMAGQFVFMNDTRNVIQPKSINDDVLYVEGSEHLIQAMKTYPKEKMTALHAPW